MNNLCFPPPCKDFIRFYNEHLVEKMKAISSCFTVGFRLGTYAVARRPFATDEIKPSKTNLVDGIKPHLRSGILSAIKKDDNGFPSYLILKETSPFLR